MRRRPHYAPAAAVVAALALAAGCGSASPPSAAPAGPASLLPALPSVGAAVPGSAAPSVSAVPRAVSSPSVKAVQRPRTTSAGVLADPTYTTAPAWAAAPAPSIKLTPHAAHLLVYERPGGPLLINLNNPLLENVPLVLSQEGAARGGWIPAALPVRPNNVLGWVHAKDVTPTAMPYSIDVYQSRHTLLVWQGSTLVHAYAVAVGKPSTPTPRGIFYVLAGLSSWGDYGPYILATSGFSEVYQTFGPDGGDAAVAIHGTNEDDSVGRSVSHGCMRVHNVNAAWLGAHVGTGTLVRVHA